MSPKIIVVITLLFIAGCVPGTVDYDESKNGWSTDDSSKTSDEQAESDDTADAPTQTPMDDPDSTEDPIASDPDAEPDTDPDTEPEPDAEPVPMCPMGQDMCVEMCVDLTSNDEHCGACDNSCPANSSCTASSCACDAADEEICGDTCVDTTTSVEHCGDCDSPCSGGMICSSGQCVENSEVAGVLQQTNAARAAGADCGVYGVKDPAPALTGDPELHEAAQVHAADMAANDFFSHTGSDGSSFVDRINRTDFVGSPIGENIAAGYGSPSAVVAGWVDSDGHCRNLMNPSATKIGIGYTTGGPYGTLWVQVFGR